MTDWGLLDAKRYFFPNSFDFTIKTVGVYTCKELLKIGCERLIEKAKTIKAIIETPNKNATLNSNKERSIDMKDVDIQATTSTIQNGYDVIVYNEDHTLGEFCNICWRPLIMEKINKLHMLHLTGPSSPQLYFW